MHTRDFLQFSWLPAPGPCVADTPYRDLLVTPPFPLKTRKSPATTLLDPGTWCMRLGSAFGASRPIQQGCSFLIVILAKPWRRMARLNDARSYQRWRIESGQGQNIS